MIRKNIKLLIGLMIGIMVSGLGVYASNSLNARNITIDNSNMSEISDNKLDTALNYLYEKTSKVGQYTGGQVCTTSTFANNALTMSSNSGMCPECVYTYTTSTWYSSSNESATVLTDEQISSFKTNYLDVISLTGRKKFLGLIINNSTKKIDRAFACSINNGVPFCIEGLNRGDERREDVYAANVSLLQSSALYNNGCTNNGSIVNCESSVNAVMYSSGLVGAYGDSGFCYVNHDGYLNCHV